jgi:hypothetical protein
MSNEEIASGCALAMTERGVIESHFFLFVIASERSERSNPLKTLNTKRNVQWRDCFTPAHLPTLRFAMTDCCVRLLRRFAPRNDGKGKSHNDGKKETRNDMKEGTRNDEKEGKAFCNKKNVTKKYLHFSKGLISNHKNFLKIFEKFQNFFYICTKKTFYCMLVKVKTFVKSMLPKINWGGNCFIIS